MCIRDRVGFYFAEQYLNQRPDIIAIAGNANAEVDALVLHELNALSLVIRDRSFGNFECALVVLVNHLIIVSGHNHAFILLS